jgi:hypothetical protein
MARLRSFQGLSTPSPEALWLAPRLDYRKYLDLAQPAAPVRDVPLLRMTLPQSYIDSSARVQSLHREANPTYHELIRCFYG